MKVQVRVILLFSLLLLIVLTGIPLAQAQEGKGILSVDAVLAPSTVYPGDTMLVIADVSSAGYDCGVDSQCFELRILSDWYTGDSSDYSLSSTFGYFTDVTATNGGVVGLYRVLRFSTDAVIPNGEYDELTFTVVLDESAVAGTNKRVFVREQLSATSFSSRASNFIEVLATPTTVYANATGNCGGNTPCFPTVQAAVDAVASGGTVNVSGSFAAGALVGKNVTIQSSNGAIIAGTITVTAGNVTLRGLSLNSGANPAINNTGAGAVTAYANNLSNTSGDIVGGTGTFDHNWWGTFTNQPGGVSLADWGERLGAPVESYGIGSLGIASLTGGTGTAVIVSHGRGSLSAPFGQATVADGNTQCSDYYDYFVQSGGGTWTVNVPIDNGVGCDSVYNSRRLFLFDLNDVACLAGPNPDPDGSCWNSLLENGAILTQVASGSNRWLRWSNVGTSELQGTPIVSGNQDDLDPTAVSLQSFGLQSGLPLWPFALALVLAAGMAFFVARRRRA